MHQLTRHNNFKIDPEFTSRSEEFPERNLLVGIVLQAISDRKRWRRHLNKLQVQLVDGNTKHPKVNIIRSIERTRCRLREVESYLFGDRVEDYFTSFRSICEQLGIDHQAARKALNNGASVNG